jgi:hypothetical protein
MNLIGSVARPFIKAPPYMGEKGLPYGCYCRCSQCGYVGRSTGTFDYHGSAGSWLLCETCVTGMPRTVDAVMCKEVSEGRIEVDPLEEWQEGAEDCG